MPSEPNKPKRVDPEPGDGTSQAQRTARALDPGHFPLDPRTVRDALEFAQRQGGTLPYYDLDDRPAGDWSAFVGDDAFVDEAAEFLREPRQFASDASPGLFRPHFTLFLAFLHLFERARGELNTLTRRHLDFYYRDFLRLTRKGPLPDRVNVLFALEPHSVRAEVPANSLLSAGQDSLGKELLYRVDRPIVVNRARIERVSSVFVERDRSGRWAGLSAAADARAVVASVDDQRLGWKTFGQPLDPAPPTIGWAVTSPLLALGEGTRTITLTLTLDQAIERPAQGSDASLAAPLPEGWFPDLLKAHFPMRFEVSTREGWRAVENQIATEVVKAHLGWSFVFTLTFGPDYPPIEPIASDPGGIASQEPALRLMLTQPEHDWPNYDDLMLLELIDVKLAVGVVGLQSLQIQNDESAPDAELPFEPFGRLPTAGSRLLLGHRELATKKLDVVTFHPEWLGLPASLKDQYRNYPPPWDEGQFSMNVSVVDRRKELPLVHVALFATGYFPVDCSKARLATNASGSFGPDLTTWTRYLVWELDRPDLGHEIYPSVAAKKAIELAIAKPPPDSPDDYLVKPPYTPLVRLTADYTASLEAEGAAATAFFHVHPFGHTPIDERSKGLRLLPEYSNEGELYIGLRDAAAPEVLSLLVQMIEGPPNPDVPAPAVDWGYLTGNRWRSASEDGQIPLDTTNGLTQSGILQVALAPVDPSTRLPADLFWLRAAAKRDTAALCNMVALYTQAASATFADHDNAPEHYGRPLPAESITQLSPPVPAIARVTQPYTSTAGRAAEAETMFDTRVSERLRHKGRSLSTWDYERLVLEGFPQIYKAKCLPATADALGKVRVVVIPDVRAMLPSSPYEPKVPTGLLEEIREYLVARAPPSAVVVVVNPRYVRVTVSASIRFTDPGNWRLYRVQTIDAIKQFLAPWAYDERADITIGGTLHANTVVNFLEHLPYVDYVTAIKVTPQNAQAAGVLTTGPTHFIDQG